MKNFRIWWQAPRKYKEREEHRSVTFLELFYDLVYVVIIAELAHSLSVDINQSSLFIYTGLFIVVWWAWFNGALYHDLHGNNDIKTRIVTFLQMIAVAGMAVFAHSAIGEGSIGFGISYSAFLLIITYLWWRTGVHDPDHRPLSLPYSLTYLVATGLMIVSLFIEPPTRYYIWLVDLGIILLLPLVFQFAGTRNAKMKKQIEVASSISSSMVERFGLLTIIVLGEVIVGVVQGVAGHHHVTAGIIITGGLGMLVAIGVWWVYFDLVSSFKPKRGLLYEAGWLYLHLPLTISIAAIGAAILNVVNHSGEGLPENAKLLLVGAVGISFISIFLLLFVLDIPEIHMKINRTARRVTIIAGIAVLSMVFISLDTLPFLLILIALMLTPIIIGVKIWIKEEVKRRAQ